MTPVLYALDALTWTKKKRSVRTGKLKANRASETKQRIERLRIGHEKR